MLWGPELGFSLSERNHFQSGSPLWGWSIMMLGMVIKVRRERRTQLWNIIMIDFNQIKIMMWTIWWWSSLSFCWSRSNDDAKELFTCVWWFDFDCQSAEDFYALNEVVTIIINISIINIIIIIGVVHLGFVWSSIKGDRERRRRKWWRKNTAGGSEADIFT